MRVYRDAFAVLILAVIPWALAAPGCSSSNTNPEGDGGASGAGGAPSCADAGDDCASCCVGAVGNLAETAFKDSAKDCVCESAPLFCTTPCADLCTGDFVTGACVVCLRTTGASCMTNHCLSPDCMDFRACLDTCK